ARLVKNKQNFGFARAHNQAITWTESEFVLVLNQDAYLAPAYLAELALCLANEERAGALTGKLLKWNFDPATFHASQFGAGQEEHVDSLGLSLSRSRKVTNLGQGEIDHGQYEVARQVWGVPATAPLYRRAALLAVSPTGTVFDEDFVSYKEDVDLAWRLLWAAYDAWYIPSAVGYHDRSLRAGQGLRAERQQRQSRARELKVYSWANHLGVLVKNDSAGNFWRDLPWILAHELAKAVFLLFTDPFTLFLGKLRFLRLLPSLVRKRRQLKPTHRRGGRELRTWWTRVKQSTLGTSG
ncbi:MAG: hypothetical protein U1C53_01495, partial [Candidatus Veblenbacteria bacterium]|nr:hypothetical protein [Candidatus Veblenbacteria bacterium]